MTTLRSRLLLATSLAVVLAAPAVAQQTADAPDDSPPADIVVTGSRVISSGDASPTPVTVMAKDTLVTVRPTSLTESLNILPVFSGSRGTTANPSAAGGVGGGNGSASQLNLRNVGSNRTLVLLDGRRVPPTSFTNIVDADIIPQMLVERVETVTGGVSAVYGSDAVSGVVNFITRKDFTGVRAHAAAGISRYGDSGQQNLGVAAGTSLFGGRGHVQVSYEYRNDDGVLRRSDRPWFTRPAIAGSVPGGGVAGSAGNPWTLIENATLANFPFGGRIIGCGTGCALAGQYFAADGVLSPFVNGIATGTAGTQIGGAGGYYDYSLKTAQRMHQLYGRFNFDLSDSVRWHVQGIYINKQDQFFTDYVQLQNITLNRDNAFLNPSYRAQMPAQTFTLSRMFEQAGRLDIAPETSQYVWQTGFDGELDRFNWSVAYIRGVSILNTPLVGNVNNQKLSAATDVVFNSAGQAVCHATTVAAIADAYRDCVPLNLFGPTSASKAALDYVLDDTVYRARTTQDNVTAEISGTAFENWAGPVAMALSAEWRHQSFLSSSDAQPVFYADCTGLRYNCVATGSRTFLHRTTFPASDTVSQAVWEAAYEVNMPLLRDVTLFDRLDVSGAVRYTSYDTVGDYWTWKLGLDWQIFSDLRLRGTLSRDIRAPTLNNLYSPTSIVIVTNTDLLTGTTQQLPSVNLANDQLTAEIGRTATIGLVYKPGFAPGLSLAVDYYKINISNAITTVQGFAATTQQGCYTGGIQLYCDLIVRNSAGAVTNWITQPINIADVRTYGVDFEVNYAGRLFGNRLNLRGLAAWQPHIRYIQPGVPTLDQGGVAFGPTGITAAPTWRLTGIASYEVSEHFRVDLMHRWRSSLKFSGTPSDVWANGENSFAAFGQTALNLAWQVPMESVGGKRAEFFLNIQNLFDNDPPLANATGSATTPGQFNGFAVTDDPIGRTFTAGVRLQF